MSDDDMVEHESGEAGASTWYPGEAGQVKKGGHILMKGDKPCKVAGVSYRDAIDHFSIIETVAKVGTDLQVQLLALSMRVCDVKKAEVAAIQHGSDFNSYDEQVPREAAPACQQLVAPTPTTSRLESRC